MLIVGGVIAEGGLEVEEGDLILEYCGSGGRLSHTLAHSSHFNSREISKLVLSAHALDVGRSCKNTSDEGNWGRIGTRLDWTGPCSAGAQGCLAGQPIQTESESGQSRTRMGADCVASLDERWSKRESDDEEKQLLGASRVRHAPESRRGGERGTWNGERGVD